MRNAVIAIGLLLPHAALGAPVLSVTGECPGTGYIDVTGLTVGGTMAVVAGVGPGDDMVPGGPCAGTVTGLEQLRFLTAVPDNDLDGEFHVTPHLPGPATCNSWIQVFDVATCEGSNTADLSPGQGWYYDIDFVGGQASPVGCNIFNLFTNNLPYQGLAGVRLSGSNDPVGTTCTGPDAQMLATALNDGLNFTTLCDGTRWSVGVAPEGIRQLWVDDPFDEANPCPNPGNILRPCLNNASWGGLAGPTCAAPSQNIRLEFQ